MRPERRRRPRARLESGLDERHRRPGKLDRSDKRRLLPRDESLQVGHPADKCVGKPGASQQNLFPSGFALGADPDSSGSPRG